MSVSRFGMIRVADAPTPPPTTEHPIEIRHGVTILAVMTLLTAGCGDAASPRDTLATGFVDVSGQVTSTSDGAPLPGIRVGLRTISSFGTRVVADSTTTGPEGRYRIFVERVNCGVDPTLTVDDPSGRFVLLVDMRVISVPCNAVRIRNVEMAPAGAP